MKKTLEKSGYNNIIRKVTNKQQNKKKGKEIDFNNESSKSTPLIK